MIQQVALDTLGLAAIAASVLMLFQKNPMRAALCMLTVIFATAGIYIILSAQLLALLQIIIYAGAIMVLFVIAINSLPQAAGWEKPLKITLSALIGLAAAALVMAKFFQLAKTNRTLLDLSYTSENILNLSALLFGKYAFQFELLSLLMLAAIIGAVASAKREL